jgi:hypothetical protein
VTEQPPLPRPKEGMGCFAKGCLTLVVVIVVLATAIIGGAWFLYGKAINVYTSTQPVNIHVEEPTDSQFQTAEGKLARLHQAIFNNQEIAIDFTAGDINALIARDPGFAGMRGRVRVGIADSIVTLELSAPLTAVPLPKLRNRWFNGRASFEFTYNLGQFVIGAKSAEANGRALPEQFFGSFNASFNRSFNERFQRDLQKSQEQATFWKRIKAIVVNGDRLIIQTQRS